MTDRVSNGALFLQKASGQSGSFITGWKGTDKLLDIQNDGSITAAGEIHQFGTLDNTPTSSESGVYFRYGTVNAKRSDSSNFVIWSGKNVAGTETSAIYGNGSITKRGIRDKNAGG